MILKPTKPPIHIFSIIYLMRIQDIGAEFARILLTSNANSMGGLVPAIHGFAYRVR
jgi:hypothetical protein